MVTPASAIGKTEVIRNESLGQRTADRDKFRLAVRGLR